MSELASITGGGLRLEFGYPDEQQYAAAVAELLSDQIASRITAQDATLWGPDAESEAAKRLSWVTLAETSRPLIAEIDALREELAAEGVDHVVLAGMGGSSLAPEVICATAGVPLVTLDTTDPGQVRAALAEDLERTVLVVSSKSGGTVETDSHRRAYEQAFTDAGIDPAAADRGGHRPGLAAAADRRGGRLPQGVPGRPGRRRPLQRADRVRPGALGPGRRRPDRAAGRRGRGGHRAVDRRRHQSRAAAGRAAGLAHNGTSHTTAPAATRWSSPTSARASPASATGPSS